MYLVDTDVISALSPGKVPPASLAAWLEARSDDLYLSAVTVTELTDGIAKAEREGAARKAIALQGWLDAILWLYGSRILPLDTAVARLAGRLTDKARGQGHAPGFADIAIAATADSHGFLLLTRNIRHFQPLGIRVADPFDRLPD